MQLEITSLLEQGVTAARKGNLEQAAVLLTYFLRHNPDSALAWIWLAGCVATPAEQNYCMLMAMDIDSSVVPSGAPAPTGPAKRPALFDCNLNDLAQQFVTRPGCDQPGQSQPNQSQRNKVAATPAPEIVVSGEVLALARELAQYPAALGRWLGYGTRLAEELRYKP